MNGIKIPKFLEGENLPQDYFATPDPYKIPKSSVNLLELFLNVLVARVSVGVVLMN